LFKYPYHRNISSICCLLFYFIFWVGRKSYCRVSDRGPNGSPDGSPYSSPNGSPDRSANIIPDGSPNGSPDRQKKNL
jgi:hypothetical protein